MRRASLGVALSDTALWESGGRRWALGPRAAGEGSWPALRDAFAELATDGRVDTKSLRIALSPPLSSARTVVLPAMSSRDRDAVLRNSLGKHFPAVREPQVVASRRVGSDADGRHRYLVVVAAASLLAAIEDAASATGWVAEGYISSYLAWAAAEPGATVSVAREDGGVEVLSKEKGVLTEIRRLRTPLEPATIAEPGPVAARRAERVRSLELVPQPLRDRRRRRSRMRMTLAASVLLIVAGAGFGASWTRTRAERQRIAAVREALRPRVVIATRAQRELSDVDELAATLARIEENGARWSIVLAALGTRLPDDAVVATVRGSGDSLTVEGIASDAAVAIASMAKVPLLSSVVPVGSIRRSLADDAAEGEPAMERFVVGARVGARGRR